MSGDNRVTRRAVLLGAVAIPLAACRPKRTATREQPPAADQAALNTALAAELALLAEYDALIVPGSPPDDSVAAARAAHAEHVRALGGRVPSPAASPTTGAGATASPTPLSRLERRSAAALRTAAISARSGAVASVLASIAASHEVFARTRQVGAG